MAESSQYKGLELFKSNEKYDVASVNRNNMIIDFELHKLELKNESQDDDLLTTKTSLNSEISRATSAENELSNDITNESNRAITAENAINEVLDSISENLINHESSNSAHSDIRNLISDLSSSLNLLADSVELLRTEVDALKEEQDI